MAVVVVMAAGTACLRWADLDGLACDDEHECLEPYVCHAGFCRQADDILAPLDDAGCAGGACDGGAPSRDAGAIDAGAIDAGAPGDDDAGERDAGEPDAGASDAGAEDAGPLDDDDAGDGGDDGGPPAGCVIDDVFYLPLAAHPTSPCLLCDPGISESHWSSDCTEGEACDDEGTCSAGCFVDGTFYAPEESPAGAGCLVCDPAATTSELTSACPGGEVCHEAQCQAGCRVDGVYFAPGAVAPDEPCFDCQPAEDTTSFSPSALDAPCDDADLCTAEGDCDGEGTCVPGPLLDCSPFDEACGVGSCDATTGSCEVTPVPEGTPCGAETICDGLGACVAGCFIDDVRYAPDETGENPCGACSPADSTTSFSPLAAGVDCGSGLVCDGNGSCGASCLIGEELYANQSEDPANECRFCDSSIAVDQWQTKANGTSCEDDGNECTDNECQSGSCSAIVLEGSACAGGGVCSAAGVCLVPKALSVQRDGSGTGTVTSSPAGINCGADCSESYTHGTVVTLTAAATSGTSSFAGWSGGGCSGTGTCVVTMSQAQSVTATFNLLIRTLTVGRNGTGTGTVTSSPAGINCGADCSEGYTHGTVVTLTAAATSGTSSFAGWAGACTGTSTCVVTMSQARSVTATFNLLSRTLTVSRSGGGAGTVTSSPTGINCGTDCSESYSHGTVVTLTATANTGSDFTGWSGGGCSGTSTCVVTMDAAKSVTAAFALEQRSLSVSTSGTGGGSVSSSPSGINCGSDCFQNYDYGTGVNLYATPTATSSFTGWSGNCSGTGSCFVSMTGSRNVTASFALVSHTLSVARDGTGTGTVTSGPSGINCGVDCSESYTQSAVVTLTAAANTSTSSFAGWSGAGCSGTGTCVVTMDAAKSVTATFTLLSRTLTVSRNGGGTGTVTSSPSGINCGADCSESYAHGTSVTLSASASAGSDFGGWSGAGCSGTGSCVVTMDAAKSVTATFDVETVQYQLTVQKLGNALGRVDSSPAGIDNCTGTCNANFDSGTVVTLTATTAFDFSGWSGPCTVTGTYTCQVTMDAAKSVSATFDCGGGC